jgi:hypothetical protein
MTRALRSLHGPMHQTRAAVAGLFVSAVSFAPLWFGLLRGRQPSAPDVIAIVVFASLASAFAMRLVAPRVAGVFASSVTSTATRSALLLAASLAFVWFGVRKVHSFGESYGDVFWMYPIVGIAHVSVFVSWSETRSDWTLDVRVSAVRWLRVVWSAVLVAVVAAACVRSVTQPAHDTERRMREGPVVGAIPSVEHDLTDASREYFYTIDTERFHRVCERSFCYLARVTPTGDATFHAYRVGPYAAEVRYDRRLDALLFTNAHGRVAFHRKNGQYFNVRRWHLVAGSAPPSSWVFAGLAGLVASAVALVAFRRAPASLLAWREARAGQRSASGAIDFDDGATVLHVADAHDLAAGPVLVDFARHTHDHGPFRGSTAHDVVAVAQGTHADVEAAIAHAEDSGEAFALLLATTACAPLLVEALCQLQA